MKKYLFLALFFITGCKTLNKSLPECYWVGSNNPTEKFDCTQESIKEELSRLEESSNPNYISNLPKQDFTIKYYAKISSHRTGGFILVYEDEFNVEKCVCKDTFTSYSIGDIERGCELVPEYLPGDGRFASCK